MARYLLDSHIFLWAKRRTSSLRGAALAEIENTQNTLFVSVAGLWELTDKASKGRLLEFAAAMEQGLRGLEDALRESGMRLLPVTLAHLVRLHRLPFHHRDPFDRIMIAQALVEDMTLISHDALFRRYDVLKLLPA